MAETWGDSGQRLDLEVRQGATLGPHPFEVKDDAGVAVDITGYVFQGQIRKHVKSSIALVEFTLSVTNGAAGLVSVEIPAATTGLLQGPSNFDQPPEKYVYDIVYTDTAGKLHPMLYGYVLVTPGVTR